ncbi:MAG TPA: hypothetical protein VD840_07775, partial [Sinorhizobium sp.]|nr:hypothetical protein [Sinorhizobium sp.]
SMAGTTLSFLVETQIYAGAQEIMPSPVAANSSAILARSTAALVNSRTSAVQSVTPTPSSGGAADNYTEMLVDPVGLTPAAYHSFVPAGTFCIAVPSYRPSPPSYTIGNAVIMKDGSVILSSFVTAPPNNEQYICVSQVFYVAAGQYAAGSAIDFSRIAPRAAKCDFTTGYATCTAIYNADGTFTVTQTA